MVVTDLSADELSQAIHSKQLSCREVMQAYLHHIDAVNPRFNALNRETTRHGKQPLCR